MVRGPRTTMKSGPRSPQLEEALAQKRRPNAAKNKYKKKKKKKEYVLLLYLYTVFEGCIGKGWYWLSVWGLEQKGVARGEWWEGAFSLKNSFCIFKNLNYEKQVRNEKPCIRKKSHGFLAAGLFGRGRRLRKPARWPPAFTLAPALILPSQNHQMIF